MIPAGIAAATSVVPTRATIQVSINAITVAEAIETMIGRARCKISRSPTREGNFMSESYEGRLLLDKRGFLVTESSSTVQQRTATVNRQEGSNNGDAARSEENQSRHAQAGQSGQEASPASTTGESCCSSADCGARRDGQRLRRRPPAPESLLLRSRPRETRRSRFPVPS